MISDLPASSPSLQSAPPAMWLAPSHQNAPASTFGTQFRLTMPSERPLNSSSDRADALPDPTLHCGRPAEKFRTPCTYVARLDPRAARLGPSCGADALRRNSARPARQQPGSTRARPAFTAAVFPSPTSCWLSSWCSNALALRCLLDRWLDDFSVIRTPY